MLSPFLFNLALASLPADLPNVADTPVHISIYADDVAIWCTAERKHHLRARDTTQLTLTTIVETLGITGLVRENSGTRLPPHPQKCGPNTAASHRRRPPPLAERGEILGDHHPTPDLVAAPGSKTPRTAHRIAASHSMPRRQGQGLLTGVGAARLRRRGRIPHPICPHASHPQQDELGEGGDDNHRHRHDYHFIAPCSAVLPLHAALSPSTVSAPCRNMGKTVRFSFIFGRSISGSLGPRQRRLQQN